MAVADWEEQIERVLNDPGQLEQISRLAQQLMGGSPPSGESAAGQTGIDPGLLARAGRLLREDAAAESAGTAALRALLPALSPKRREKLSRAMRLAHMGRLAAAAFGEEREHV